MAKPVPGAGRVLIKVRASSVNPAEWYGTSGQPRVVRDPAAVRPWQHVLNPLSGYLLLAERLAGSGDYARGWIVAPPLEDDQRPVGWLVERFGTALRTPLEVRSPERRDGPVEAARLGLDPTLAAERLGWRERWPLERGLDETAAWYRQVVFEGADARAVTLAQLASFGSPAEPGRTSTAAG